MKQKRLSRETTKAGLTKGPLSLTNTDRTKERKGERESEKENIMTSTVLFLSDHETAEEQHQQHQQQQQQRNGSRSNACGEKDEKETSCAPYSLRDDRTEQTMSTAQPPRRQQQYNGCVWSSSTSDTTATISTEMTVSSDSSSSHSSSNESLAGSSITTTERQQEEVEDLHEQPEDDEVEEAHQVQGVTLRSPPTPSPTQTTTTTTTSSSSSSSSTPSTKSSSPWKPHSLKDLIRRDLTSTDTTIVITALQQITLDCWDCPIKQSAVARAGGLLAVIQAMERHCNDVNVQVVACQAIQQLVSNCADNQHAISALGGLDAILAALMTHFDNVMVQEAAWGALRYCTAGTAAQQRLTLDTAAPGAGLQVLLHAVEHHTPHSAVVAGHALMTIANLCVASTERTHQLVRANGLVLLAETLQQHHYEYSQHHGDTPNTYTTNERKDDEMDNDDREAISDMAHALERLCKAVRERHQSPPQPAQKYKKAEKHSTL